MNENQGSICYLMVDLVKVSRWVIFTPKMQRKKRFLHFSNSKDPVKNFANKMDAKICLTLDRNRKNPIFENY